MLLLMDLGYSHSPSRYVTAAFNIRTEIWTWVLFVPLILGWIPCSSFLKCYWRCLVYIVLYFLLYYSLEFRIIPSVLVPCLTSFLAIRFTDDNLEHRNSFQRHIYTSEAASCCCQSTRR